MILLNNNKFSNAIIIIILFLPFITATAYAAGGETDSIGVTLRSDSALMVELLNKQRKSQQKFTVFTKKEIETPVYQILHAAVPLFIVGGVASAFDNDFKVMRSSYIPGFRHHYDDYLQYSPAVLMMIMKAAGVEGRSSWGRMLVSDAFSVAAMTFLVNGLKYTVRRERPDGSSNNSFPSGHAATAFMTATMFHKEYGLTRSPLYSVLGYSLATATAISRQFNNRHWMSDVLVGAGIGI
ncbi:MAG: phosphatase PAP2 family protein, partial [Rikenellaceae bacterium]